MCSHCSDNEYSESIEADARRRRRAEAFEPVTDALGQDAMQNVLEIWFLRCSAQQRGQSYTAATAVVAEAKQNSNGPAHVNLPVPPEKE